MKGILTGTDGSRVLLKIGEEQAVTVWLEPQEARFLAAQLNLLSDQAEERSTTSP